MNTFELYAGLKLNKSKTEAMWIGKNMNNTTTPLNIKWVKHIHSLGIFFSYDSDYVVQKNFMDRAREFKRILDMWSQRDLSLIGKITVLKSLAFSKVIYQCGVLPCPPKFIQHLNDLAYKFVWSNKKDKIKRTTLIAEYEKGGLKMLDIESFTKAQKVTWVKRLVSNDGGSWKALPTLFFKELLGENTFKCNTSHSTKPKDFPGFYWQILKSWLEFKSLTNHYIDPVDIRRESLWLNKHILINGEEIKWPAWIEHGINLVHDLVNENGTFLNIKDFEKKYKLRCNVFEYNSIKDAIPSEWRKRLKKRNVNNNEISINDTIQIKIGKNQKPINKLTNKDVYWTFINNIATKPIIIDKMQMDYNIETSQMEKVFAITKVLRQTKIRTFQYKVLFNLIPCNLYLNRIERSDTDKCASCQTLDDIPHYFYECNEVKYFWEELNRWWNNVTETDRIINQRDIILGILENKQRFFTLNACILLAKWHIYKCKLDNSKIYFYKFVCDFKYFLKIEKIIYQKQDHLDQYNKTWGNIELQLNLP